MSELREMIAAKLANRDGYAWEYYTDNEQMGKYFVTAFLAEYRAAANEFISLMKVKLRGLTDEEIGLLEWDSATLDMSFVDDYSKEVEALLSAQRDKFKKDNLEMEFEEGINE